MHKYLLWIASGIVSFLMILGGGMKLTGQEVSMTSFQDLGLPVAFGLFIGVCELAGGIGIWLKRFSSLAAVGIGIIMLGAIYYHVQFPPLVNGIPALLVLLSCIYVFFQRLPYAPWRRATA